MALLDDLRQAAAELDPQFQPASNELAGLLAAVIQFLDHGKKFLKAAGEGPGKVNELVSGVPADDDGDDDGAEGTPEQRDEHAAKSSRRATAHQTKAGD